GTTQDHQGLDVVTGIEEETPYGGVGNLLRQRYRTQMEADESLDLRHILVHRQFQAPENTGDHPRSLVFVSMEGPAVLFVIPFGRRLGDIVKNSRPPEPEVVGNPGHIVEHLERMEKVLLMRIVTHVLDAVQGDKLRKELLKQSAVEQQLEAVRRHLARNDLVQLVRNAFL